MGLPRYKLVYDPHEYYSYVSSTIVTEVINQVSYGAPPVVTKPSTMTVSWGYHGNVSGGIVEVSFNLAGEISQLDVHGNGKIIEMRQLPQRFC